MPSQREFDRLNSLNRSRRAKEIRQAYIKAIQTMVSVLRKTGDLNIIKTRYFTKNKRIQAALSKMLETLFNDVYGTTVEGINSSWELAVEKNNETAKKIYGKQLADLPAQYKNKYLSNNADAKKAFIYRKNENLSLSEKVWNNTKLFKKDLELALELGIGKGKSATELSKYIQQFLNQPNKLFRRVRDENGVLRLSKAAKAYHPGQGIYRSSYKNAMRLARNEINFSYERSNHEKITQQDFVIGIRIKVSPNHNPSDDAGGISCYALQGDYPKNFNWTYKWHVNCKCMSLNILKTPDELNFDIDNILSDGEPIDSENKIDSTPKNFNDYINTNKNKWKNWKNQPRFITDNKKVKGFKYNYLGSKVTTDKVKAKFPELYYFDVLIDYDVYEKYMSGFDIERFTENVINSMKEYEIEPKNIRIHFNGSEFSVGVRKNGEEVLMMSRHFTYYEGKRYVHHDYFSMRKNLQGAGLSKALFSNLYEEYKAAGIDYIRVGANIDVGGYAWGKYGFCQQLYPMAHFIESRFEGANYIRAKEIFDEWDANNPNSDLFPMNLLANVPQLKKGLLNSSWTGILDLNDPIQTKIFEDYLKNF